MKRIFALLVLAWVLHPTCSQAISPYRIELRGDFSKLESRSARHVRLSLFTHEGVRKVELQAKNFTAQRASSRDRFFTGRAIGRSSQNLPRFARGVSASVTGDKLELTLFGSKRGRAYVAKFDRSQLSQAGPITGRLGHLPSNFALPCPLGVKAHTLPQTVGSLALEFGAGSGALYNPYKVVDIATLADHGFYGVHGSSSDSDILAKMAAASAFWEDDVGLSLNVISQATNQTAGTDPLTSSTDSNTLLENFACTYGYCNSGFHSECVIDGFDCSGVTYQGSLDSSADLYTLFTDRTLNSSVIGLAYLGTVCQISGGLAYNLIGADGYSVWPYAHLIIAHEYGHSFNAPHSSDNSLMDPVLDPSITGFGASSVSTITSYVDSFGSCLADGAPNYNLGVTLESVSYSKSSKRFSFKISTDNMPLQGVTSCRLRLVGAKTAADALNGSGSSKELYEPHTISASADLSSSKRSSKALSYKFYTGNSSSTRYFVAELTCGSEIASSAAKSLKFTKLSSKTNILTTLDKAL
ncbi:MAG: zinc-dependent metalloprotease [Oligoflexia bacterium]|nr:zinc-dependent metalloprotease [Oligoflexia bacterium]